MSLFVPLPRGAEEGVWPGDMPAPLKAFFEQVFRPGFGFEGGQRMRHGSGGAARVAITARPGAGQASSVISVPSMAK